VFQELLHVVPRSSPTELFRDLQLVDDLDLDLVDRRRSLADNEPSLTARSSMTELDLDLDPDLDARKLLHVVLSAGLDLIST